MIFKRYLEEEDTEMSRFALHGNYNLNTIMAASKQMHTHTGFVVLHLVSNLKSLTPIIGPYMLENSYSQLSGISSFSF